MDKREQIARMAQTKEDEILLARVYERITSAAARNIPAATAFLSKREQMLAAELLRGQDFVFFGGPAMAEREVCCYVPEYLDEGWLTGDEGPIAAVRAVYFAGDTLTHRDFLGALMGCGIKRETVGDIYVSEGSCDFLVTREILPYLLQNFLSAGRTKLHVEQLPIDQIRVPEQKVKAVRDTVASWSRTFPCRSRRSGRSATPCPPCGSTASFPPAFPSAAARPRTISPPENAS